MGTSVLTAIQVFGCPASRQSKVLTLYILLCRVESVQINAGIKSGPATLSISRLGNNFIHTHRQTDTSIHNTP